jgi:hypothetical protein
MADENTIDRPSNLEEFQTSKTGEDNRIDRAAEEAAQRAIKREQKYDEGHNIFTK